MKPSGAPISAICRAFSAALDVANNIPSFCASDAVYTLCGGTTFGTIRGSSISFFTAANASGHTA
jgi:hypothetical protein